MIKPLIEKENIPLTLIGKWGQSVLSNGWTTIPNQLLFRQKELELSNSEMMMLIHIISFICHPMTPAYPSIETLANRINQHPRTVQRTIEKLISKKLLKKTIRSKGKFDKGMTNLYGIDPLIQKLMKLNEQNALDID